MKELLKSEKIREILKLAETKHIAVYILKNDDLRILDVEETKKQLFMDALVKIYPSLLSVDEESCRQYKEICSKSLQELKSAMKEVVQILSDMNALYISDFLGLDENLPMNYVQIAKKYNKSSGYIYSIIHKATDVLLLHETKNKFLSLLGLIELSSDNCMYLYGIDSLKEEFHYIQHLPLSTRAYNALHRNKIYILEQLAETTEKELLRCSRFGKNIIEEIRLLMDKYGICFKDEKETENE